MKLPAVLFVLFILAFSSLPMLPGPSETASAESLPAWTRTFHLHEGAVYEAGQYDWMNSSGAYNPGYVDYDGDGWPGITIRKNVPPQRWHHWILDPAANSSAILNGDISISVWAKSRDNESGSLMTAILFDVTKAQWTAPDTGIEIGRVTIPMAGPVYSQEKLYSLTVPSVSHTLADGHYLVLTLQRGDSLNDGLIVLYDDSYYDSYLTLRSETFVSVDALQLEDSDGNPRSVFSDAEQITAKANLSNTFGAYDTVSAMLTVTYSSNGTVVFPSTAMSLEASGPQPTAYWKLFNLTVGPLTPGSLEVNVSAYDPQGSPSWLTVPVTIVTVDHFGVVAPATIVAGQPFSMTVSALDSDDQVVTNWVGTVQLEAFLTDRSPPWDGELSNTSAVITLADSGQVTIVDQTYTNSSEPIVIRAMSGTHEGWSDAITVLSAPVMMIAIEMDPPGVQLQAGSSITLTAIGHDEFGNENTTWEPNWTASSSNGTIVGSGLSVTFVGVAVGDVNVTCRNDPTGASTSVELEVIAGDLFSIVINSPTNPLQIREGLSQALTATGYDSSGNEVDISGATWDTDTSGSVVGSGSSATYTAGYLPEDGFINVRFFGVVGSLEVDVLESMDGPWLSQIPVQIKNEDAGAWTFSLTGYWHDVDGTSTLYWWVEGVNTSLYFISHAPASNAQMLFNTQPDMWGEGKFMLWVIDDTLFRTCQEITVRILPLNDRPRFVNDPPDTLYVRYETDYTFDYTYYVADVDNPKADLNLVLADPQPVYGVVSFDELIASFAFQKRSDVTIYYEFVYVEVHDLADSSSLSVVVRVTDDYPPSMNASLPDLFIDEGDVMYRAFDLDDYFYDSDKELLIYTYGFQHLEVWINIFTREVFINASEEWWGVTEGTFTALDPDGALKVDTVVITVAPVPDAPRLLKEIDDIIVRYETPYILYLSSYIYDPDNSMDSLTYVINSLSVTHTSTSDGYHLLELLFDANLTGPTYTGPYMVHVSMTVTDPDGLSVVCLFNVTVTDDYPPSIIASDPEEIYYSFAEDSYLNNTLRLYELFADPDPEDVQLTFEMIGLEHVKAITYAGGVVNLTADMNWSGAETLDIKAIDSHGAWAALRAYVTVTEVNDAPVLMLVPDAVTKGGSRNPSYYIRMYVFDSDDDYQDLTVSAEPFENAAVIGDWLYVTLPDGVDVITVSLTVSDGDLESSARTFRIGVSKTMAEVIGYPYSLPLVLLAAAVGAYFASMKLPRPSALENLFLIHNDGRLIHHVTKVENTLLDKDVVSAMFTAVQEFVKDSFQKGEVGLKKLEIGDKNVVIEKGQYAYVALIYSGWPTKEVFKTLALLLQDVEERYTGRLEKWNGTMKAVKGIEKMLQDYMDEAYKVGAWQEEQAIADEEWVDILDKEA
ncbi:MAG TPA: hypothetical protein VF374_05505 [Thermoplasmata archaeon]